MTTMSENALQGTTDALVDAPGVTGRPGPASFEELVQVNRDLDGATPGETIAWTFERFGDGVVLTSSFQDCVLVDLAAQVRSLLTVTFLDTGFHFAETLAYLEQVRERLGITVEVVASGLGPNESPCGSPGCCELRKVRPLAGILAGRSAWITGVKRVDTPERASAARIGWDPAKRVVKVNPIVSWTEEDVEDYVVRRDLPRHPLNALGYLSIGCAPTTRPVLLGEDPRAGRWSGTKTECGLHL